MVCRATNYKSSAGVSAERARLKAAHDAEWADADNGPSKPTTGDVLSAISDGLAQAQAGSGAFNKQPTQQNAKSASPRSADKMCRNTEVVGGPEYIPCPQW